ncbi:MAG: TetR/AcrR family transcriptional regulator [Acholeplasmatales bacterium]|nr:TetR/AcrR family transcriptional regulator [Acholeplasmatales bacterium]
MRKIDPRVAKTKNSFKEATKELMLIHDNLDDISVKELCEKAKLNRRTFYLHYRYIDDVLNEVQDEFFDKFIEKTRDYDYITNVEPEVRAFFELLMESPVQEKIILSPQLDYIREKHRLSAIDRAEINDNLKSIKNFKPTYQRIITNHYYHTLLDCYREWVSLGKTIPIEEMINLTSSLLTNGMSAIIKNK